ncbi:unnamed product [Ostreococcus tauri]|uniref:Unnamed product n=2 Tax=Ostreococcus tauri TaxID=70448 RepID=A0A090LYC6_OSTTA|nr:unnamed product [Ostreococcus tauri]CEF96786.1 unnamed product [Ostreococcus tauri]|eukprot:XP_003074507.2 unnamed product [Ostreococcus tauri]
MTTFVHASFLGMSANTRVAVGLVAFASATFAFPVWYSWAPSKVMWTQDEGLSVAAVRRGAFMNSGSRDVGLDKGVGKKE